MEEKVIIPRSVRIMRSMVGWMPDDPRDHRERLRKNRDKSKEDQKMTEIPREKVEELLEQARFSKKEVKRIKLLSDSPVPVVEIESRSGKKQVEDMRKMTRGESPDGTESQGSTYQCLLLGKILGVKRCTFIYHGDTAWQLKRFEVAVYRKNKNGVWDKVVFAEHEDDDCKPAETCIPYSYFGPRNKDEFDEVDKVANFIKLLVDELECNCRIQFSGARE